MFLDLTVGMGGCSFKALFYSGGFFECDWYPQWVVRDMPCGGQCGLE